MLEQIKEATAYLQGQTNLKPEVGIILGTGLGGLVNEIDVKHRIEYDDIPNFPVSTVESHHGKLIFGRLGGKNVVAMQGRFHYYEGYTMQQIVLPVRVMKLLGIGKLFVSNASGAVNPDYRCGDLMIQNDHINLLGDNPLRGPNLDEFGPRFPDMSEPYDKSLIDLALQIVAEQEIPKVQLGAYASVMGPNLETPAEYRYLRNIGADVVGMSTIPEVLAARHAGLPCFAISVVTDEGWRKPLPVVTVEDVIKVAGEAEPRMTKIMSELIARS